MLFIQSKRKWNWNQHWFIQLLPNRCNRFFFLSNFQFKLAYGLNKNSNQQNRGFQWINVNQIGAEKNGDKKIVQCRKPCQVTCISRRIDSKLRIRMIFVFFALWLKCVVTSICSISTMRNNVIYASSRNEYFTDPRPEMIGIIAKRNLITSKCFVHFWCC